MAPPRDCTESVLDSPEGEAALLAGLAHLRLCGGDASLADFKDAVAAFFLALSNRVLPTYRGGIKPHALETKDTAPYKENMFPVPQDHSAKRGGI